MMTATLMVRCQRWRQYQYIYLIFLQNFPPVQPRLSPHPSPRPLPRTCDMASISPGVQLERRRQSICLQRSPPESGALMHDTTPSRGQLRSRYRYHTVPCCTVKLRRGRDASSRPPQRPCRGTLRWSMTNRAPRRARNRARRRVGLRRQYQRHPPPPPRRPTNRRRRNETPRSRPSWQRQRRHSRARPHVMSALRPTAAQ